MCIFAMEFKFRTDDNGGSRPSTYIPPSSTNPFYTEHALSAGFFSADARMPGMESNPLDITEVIQRERDKSKIREEILTAEILRRQELEAEVRRELMIERAMMRSDGLSLFDSSMPLLQSDLWGLPLHYQNGIGIGMEEKLSMMIRPQVGSFRALPFQQREPVIKRLPEGKNSLLPGVNKGQALLAELINSNAAGIKRKAETLAISGGNRTPSISTSKKPQKEWRCALCQVSTTSELALNEHLQGKKHKAKESLLRASKTVSPVTKNSYPFSKKRGMSTEQAVSTGSLNRKDGKSPNGNQEVMKNGNAVELKMQNTEDLMVNGGVLSDKKRQHLKFWCRMCNFGTKNETLMEAHQNGMKHMTLLRKNGGAVIAISTVPENVQRAEGTIAAKCPKEDLMDNAEEIDETATGPEGKYSPGNAEESKETASKGEKKDTLGNTDGEADGMKIDGEKNADRDKLAGTGDNSEVPCSTMEVI